MTTAAVDHHQLRMVTRKYGAPYFEEAIQLGRRIAEAVDMTAVQILPRKEIESLETLAALDPVETQGAYQAPWTFVAARDGFCNDRTILRGWNAPLTEEFEIREGWSSATHISRAIVHSSEGAAERWVEALSNDIVAGEGALPTGFDQAVVADRLRREVIKSFAVYYAFQVPEGTPGWESE